MPAAGPGENVRPLSGLRILDLTIIVAGPVATGLLADLGAEVIKVENTVKHQAVVQNVSLGADGGDPRRQLFRTPNFLDLNRGKRGITLNLNLPEARDVFKRLAAVSDVVIENFSPRVMRNFGLEYDDLVKVKPDIICVSMPAFGRSGPFRDRSSFGPGIDALSGLAHLTGYADSTPLKPGNYFCDYNAGVLAATAIMAAVLRKRRTGKGQYVEVAMRDGLTQMIGDKILDYVLNKRLDQRMANRDLVMAPHNIYPCAGADRWLAISARNDADWAALCRVLQRPELIDEPAFATMAARKANEARVDEIVAGWTRSQDPHEAMLTLQAAGVPAGWVATTKDLSEDPQFRHREAFQTIELWNGRKMTLQRAGWQGGSITPKLGRPPSYSEHTVSVLRDLLGMTKAEIRTLADAGGVIVIDDEELEGGEP